MRRKMKEKEKRKSEAKIIVYSSLRLREHTWLPVMCGYLSNLYTLFVGWLVNDRRVRNISHNRKTYKRMLSARHFDSKVYFSIVYFHSASIDIVVWNDSMACNFSRLYIIVRRPEQTTRVRERMSEWDIEANEKNNEWNEKMRVCPRPIPPTHRNFGNVANIAAHLFRLLVLWSIVLGFENW